MKFTLRNSLDFFVKRKKIILITAVILVIAVILVLLTLNHPAKLVLQDADDGTIYGTFALPDDQIFAITFVHSVNKSAVTDYYQVIDGQIYLIKTAYYGFGAGVPTELYGDQVFSYGDDGEMIISNMDTLIPTLTYVVGTVSDHTLTIGEDEISLRDLCGRNSSVTFIIK